jgi:peroxiredoxin
MMFRNMNAGPRRLSKSEFSCLVALMLALAFAQMPAAVALTMNQEVPDFKVPDLQGDVRTLQDFSGKATVLLFWRPEAERARNAVCALASAVSSGYEGMRLVTIVSGEHEQTAIDEVLAHCSGPVPVLLDRDRAVFSAYQIIALPTAMILGADRKLKYKEAGFSHAGIAALTGYLDEMYGRAPAATVLPEGAPEAIRRYGLALQFLRLGLTERAEELLDQLVKVHPEYRPAWVSLGYCRIAAGKVAESQECLEKAYDLEQNNPDVAAGLAWVWWKKGDSAQSEKWAAMVTDKDPNGSLILEIKKDAPK